MRKELEEIARIEEYLMGKLNATEKLNFESAIAADNNLRDNVNFQRDLMTAIQRVGLKQKANKARKNYRTSKLLKKLGWGALIAGTLAAGTYYLLENSGESPVNNTIEIEQSIELPANDTLSSVSNQYLDQEVFRLNTKQDTVIETKDGIVVAIPANAFETESGSVDLLVQGAVQPSDILKAGLSTETEDGKTLETGGMFYLDAFENGKRVNPTKNLTVDVPTEEKLPGMQIYDGVKDENGEIVWTTPQPVETFLTPVDILTLDFYPPGYEGSLDSWGLYGKTFRDSLYYSFAFKNGGNCATCEDRLAYTWPQRKITPQERDFLYADNRPIDQLMTQEEAIKLCKAGMLYDYGDPAIGEKLFNGNCASCHFPDRDMTGPALKGARQRWIENSSEENFYAWIKNSSSVIKSGDTYAKEIERFNPSVMTPQAVTNEQIDHIFAYIECVGLSYPVDDLLSDEEGENTPLYEVGDDTLAVAAVAAQDATTNTNEIGVDPAAVKTIWNTAFNKTNLATKAFEERVPWIHHSCETEVLNIYVQNMYRPLYYSDSLVAQLTFGEVRKQFQEFAQRKEGRVQEINAGGNALYNYYEKKRKANAEAIHQTQEKYWSNQAQKDQHHRHEESLSDNRSHQNKGEIFKQEFDKNMEKVKKDLGLNKGIPRQNTSSYTVIVSTLGWKNIDREVLAITGSRETGTVKLDGKESTLTYESWSATIVNAEKYDRINVYNIPKDFNSYVKLKQASGGRYAYNLNADLKYQTLVLAWTEKSIFFYQDKKTKPGDHNLKLKPITNDEFQYNVVASLKPIAGMESEMKYIEYAQKDQVRINRNEQKELLREKAERVIFKCREEFMEMPAAGHGAAHGHGSLAE